MNVTDNRNIKTNGISLLQTGHSLSTVYWEIFMSLNFCEFCEFCSVVKLNFMKVLPCHTFDISYVDHSQKYFSRKFNDAKISWYTVFPHVGKPRVTGVSILLLHWCSNRLELDV